MNKIKIYVAGFLWDFLRIFSKYFENFKISVAGFFLRIFSKKLKISKFTVAGFLREFLRRFLAVDWEGQLFCIGISTDPGN